ncbi:unnamed protein product [Trypanosoma congolense IL3000]|uniref:Kinesin-like protein n=1 Tax=Trypanosoma congolense (strain IL3000) TaxID=1068625 RepID=F9WAY3_TRYCI|nr:unnamed protein product [Trypanosoma congolense IL3000]
MESIVRKPRVRALMRFRPLSEDERELQRREGTPEPWLMYDGSVVRVKEIRNSLKRVHGGGFSEGDVASPERDVPSTALLHAPVVNYSFDAIFSDMSTQQDVYDIIGVSTVENVLKGYNSTIFSYGMTGSGKTHTMYGPSGALDDMFLEDSPHYSNRGLVPRIVEELFKCIGATNAAEGTWQVQVQMFEIYKDSIVDLLHNSHRPQPEHRIREDNNENGRGIYVDALEAVKCESAEELLSVLQCGTASRHTRETGVNDRSSRSHCLLCIFVKQRRSSDPPYSIESRLNLVDLAGSERIAQTGAEGESLKEAQHINLSLALLGNVIQRQTNAAPGNTEKLRSMSRDEASIA